MFSNKEAIVSAQIGYLRAEGRPDRLSPEVSPVIKKGLIASSLYEFMTDASLNDQEEPGLSHYEQKQQLKRASEITGAVKVIRALQEGYKLIPEDQFLGAVNFDEITKDPETYRRLPRILIYGYGRAIDSNLFDDFFYKVGPSGDSEIDHILIGGIRTSSDYSIAPEKGKKPIEKATEVVFLNVPLK